MRNVPIQSERHPVERVIHAGALVLQHPSGPERLAQYLNSVDEDRSLLLHRGHREIEKAASQTSLPTNELAGAKSKSEEELSAEIASRLHADALDFVIDAPVVYDENGNAAHELSIGRAEALSECPGVRKKIREKLAAGCDAFRKGVARVRFGSPETLTRGNATELVPDPQISYAATVTDRPAATSWNLRRTPVGACLSERYERVTSAWWRLRGSRHHPYATAA